MHLLPMTPSEFDFWQKRSVAAYVQDKMKANSLSREDAEAIASADFARFLPNGLESPNSWLFTAKESDGSIIGFAWFVGRGQENNKRAFITDIIVEERFRGRGYGKKMMLELENRARGLGFGRIGLHVFGYNKVAIGLYESLGYESTDISMEKVLKS